MHYNCLIVDDETDLAKMTSEYFQMFDVSCSYVESGSECRAFLYKNQVDLILLDINMHDETGFQVCKNIREYTNVPIIFISARQSDDDILIALNIGGDDYIKKPYSLSVLLAKVKVMLKRTSTFTNVPEIEKESSHGMTLNEARMSASINGKEIVMKAREYSLLAYLYEHKNTIVGKEELFDNVWGDEFFSDGTLNVHIRRLREKLEDNPNEPKLIKTIWGTGYMLEL